MIDLVKIQEIQEKIISINDMDIILDRDVATIYNVETKRINEAVKNNPKKFSEGYIIQLSDKEWSSLKSKISTLKGSGRGRHTKYIPKGFTEKGLYMLATILKSDSATETTIHIIETFSRVKELSTTVSRLSKETNSSNQKTLVHRGGELMAELLGDNLVQDETETSFELNFAVLKFKHTVKKKKKE